MADVPVFRCSVELGTRFRVSNAAHRIDIWFPPVPSPPPRSDNLPPQTSPILGIRGIPPSVSWSLKLWGLSEKPSLSIQFAARGQQLIEEEIRASTGVLDIRYFAERGMILVLYRSSAIASGAREFLINLWKAGFPMLQIEKLPREAIFDGLLPCLQAFLGAPPTRMEKAWLWSRMSRRGREHILAMCFAEDHGKNVPVQARFSRSIYCFP